MTFMVWNPHLETGIAIVDQQHRGLVDMLNQAAPLLAQSSQESLRDIAPLLDGLLDYAATHFETEEALMARLHMDERARSHHRASHAQFAEQVGEMVRAYAGDAGVTGDRLLSFLASWLVLHILGEDQAMARQVRALEAGATPLQAYDEARGAETRPPPAALSHALVDIYTTLTQQNRQLSLSNRDLDASRAEIQRHNANLEHLVGERTAQLEQLAADLRQARDAAEAGSRAKTRFLGAMSHELRTPLNAIQGYACLLRDAPLPTSPHDLSGRIVEASEHLLELINGVVDYARLDTDRVELQQVDFHPSGLLAEASRRAFRQAREKGLGGKLEIDPALPTVLRGETRSITRVLGLFADNAVKFTRQGGIRLCAQLIARSRAGEVRVRFLVEDTGIGIAQADQNRLFQAFSQLDDSPDRRYEGIGLGLALAQQLARLIGGEVGVESSPGKGSRFWLELTLAQGNVVAPAPPPKPEETVPVDEMQTGRRPPDDVLASLQLLEQYLADFDTRAGQILLEVAPNLRPFMGARVDELGRLIAAFDYDLALAELKPFSRRFEQGANT